MTVAMQPDSPLTPTSFVDPTPAARLAESAKGWHSIQLAVLGFIGFCGVLRMGAEAAGPEWLKWLAAALSVLAFVFALGSVFLVGKVAYPLGEEPAAPAAPAAGREQLRSGIRLTFTAVALLALAGVTAWWPAETGAIEVQDGAGTVACGVPVEGSPDGILWLDTAGGRLTVKLGGVAAVRSVSGC